MAHNRVIVLSGNAITPAISKKFINYRRKNVKNKYALFLEIKKKRNLTNFEFYIDHCTHKSKIILAEKETV